MPARRERTVGDHLGQVVGRGQVVQLELARRPRGGQVGVPADHRDHRPLSPSAERSRTGIASCRAGVSPYQTGSPSRQIRPCDRRWRGAPPRARRRSGRPGRPGRRSARWSGAPGPRRGTPARRLRRPAPTAAGRRRTDRRSTASHRRAGADGRYRRAAARCAPRLGHAGWTRRKPAHGVREWSLLCRGRAGRRGSRLGPAPGPGPGVAAAGCPAAGRSRSSTSGTARRSGGAGHVGRADGDDVGAALAEPGQHLAHGAAAGPGADDGEHRHVRVGHGERAVQQVGARRTTARAGTRSPSA